MNVIPYPRRSLKRSRFATRRSRLAVSRIPRALRYNGENKITRNVTASLPNTQTGFTIGASQFAAVNIVFDVTSVTIYGGAFTSVTFPMVNSAEIAGLYDRVSIDKVELTLSTSVQAPTISNPAVYKYIICNDNNDGIGSASVEQIRQQPNKVHYAVDGTPMTWSCRPSYQRVVYLTSTISNYEPARGFVNSNTAIPHYGMKLGIDNLANMGPNTAGFTDMSFKFFLSMKNVK